MNLPRVSVIIPSYNRASLVGETIESVLRQTHPPHEVIVVDDGSTDDTLQVLESFGSRLRILRQTNAGPGAARNAGLAVATGDYVWLMDSDDLASLNKIEVQLRALDQGGQDIAIGPWIMCRLDGDRAVPETHVLQQKGLPRQTLRAFLCNWTIILQTALFRRSFLDKVGGFNPSPDFIVVEDQLLFLKCFLAGARLVHTPACLVVYRTDGVNKITDVGFDSGRRLRNVASYLLEAHRLCLQAGEDPVSWFLFRLRVWGVWRALNACNSPGTGDIVSSLGAVLGQPSNVSLDALARKCLQWLGGFRQRAFGDRSSLGLRAGPIRPGQVSLLRELGYTFSGR